MSAFGITYLDPIVVLVVLVSAGYATWRGFVSETLSIFAWAAAAFATLFFGPRMASVGREFFPSSPVLGVMVGYAAIFLIVLIPLSFLSFRFSESVKHSAIGTLDRSLGFAFGVVRGLAIIGLAYIAFTTVIPVKSQPAMVADAKLLPVVQVSAQALLSLVPDQHLAATASAAPAQPQTSAQTQTAPVPTPKPSPPKHGKKGYGAKERSQLDNLIDSTSATGKP